MPVDESRSTAERTRAALPAVAILALAVGYGVADLIVGLPASVADAIPVPVAAVFRLFEKVA